MKKIFLLIVGMAVVLTACGDSATTVNDKIVDAIDGTEEHISKVMELIYDSEYDDASVALDELKKHVSEASGQISALKNKSGEEFLQKSVAYLKLVETEAHGVYANAIEQYRKADDSDDEAQSNRIYSETGTSMENLTDKLEGLYSELQSLQKAFADKNNIELK